MSVFWFLFIYLFIIYIFSNSWRREQQRQVQTIFSGLGVWSILALRSPLCGTDLYSNEGDYFHSFSMMSDYSFAEIIHSAVDSNMEKGWLIYNKLISCITNDFQVFLAITAGICLILIGFVFYKYSRNVLLSFIVYVSFGLYIFSFSGLRQAMALSITFFSYYLLNNKKYLWFVACVFLASTMHNSAIIFLVALPLTKFELSFKRGLICIYLLTGSLFFLRDIVNWVTTVLFPSRYGNYQDEGGAITMFFVYILLFLLSYITKNNNNSKMQFYRWMILCAIVCQSLGFIGSGAITRIGYYFSIFFPLIVIETVADIKNTQYRHIVNVAISIAFILFFYLTTKDGYLNVVPYRFYWETNL